ncbi:uncharacterized protein LOC108291379 isoform X1 [Cebus imitator]|uniref:uncharacterized protein LOC108291379 isoform X1 n=1 Tax=Cebus imitator TaxID=2715852 RepID=UPI00080A0F0E|nr:uncharacterized protein LOC108291379 isoform X1 [Cebus imitator]
MNPCGWLGAVGPTLPHFRKWATSFLEPQVLPWQAQMACPVSAGASPWIPGMRWPLAGPVTAQLDGFMVPALLLLQRPQGCISGPPAESAYTKVRLLVGETLSVLCSYKGYRNRVDGKVWCKVRRRKCEPGFTRVWVKGPRYLLQDDAQAKVVHITMAALTLQDSGRYWCMRNSSGTLYPMLGIQLDVSPGEWAGGALGRVDGVLPAPHSTNIRDDTDSNPSVAMWHCSVFRVPLWHDSRHYCHHLQMKIMRPENPM